MTTILFLVIGISAGALIGWLAASRKQSGAAAELKNLELRNADLAALLAQREIAITALQHEASLRIAEKAQLEERASRIPALESEVRSREAQINLLNEQNSGLQVELADRESSLEAEKSNLREQKKLLEEAKDRMSDAFRALSAEALRSNNQSFLDLAEGRLKTSLETAKGDLEKRQQAINEVVRPVGEKLDKFAERVRELELERKGAYSTLFEQVKTLTEGQTMLRSETTNLVRALRTPNTRGRWGEIQLKRVVELAGMVDHCDFEEQVSQDTDTGRQRPDMIVKLPGGKNIIVDAKVPLAAYLDALETTDDAVRKARMIDHARQVREHIKQLSRKSYWEQFKPTPEFVVLFLSGEAFLYAALEQDPALIEDGITDKVILATPTTLIAMLKAVAYGWRQENLEKNAREISELGADLYKRLATVGDHFTKLGTNLRKTVESYNDSVGSLERNLLPGARKLKEHDVATGGKEIDEIEQISVAPRILTAAELFSTDEVNSLPK